MAMNIKNARVHALAREAAERTGTTQTSALEAALESYLAGLDSSDDPVAERIARAQELAAQITESWTDADREAVRRHLAGMYDEDGLPA
ncbi:type II toxin-antitoxin system VapB family antitoxin [Janibacter sp. YIM B02568]|uniref:type II toxin-antitoxin system VapB family antitoxin n=1 Tax=Janibacter endophyticus TaxID=2806261 RepID=UPI00194DCD87|nr:type II toxin-antitoxin system VapB family antitoxin [Janibacter endophyticus]MBM6546118.1 type II toxin-antitoxin system VapB family antitoxin [Janibacter endophyticus]